MEQRPARVGWHRVARSLWLVVVAKRDRRRGGRVTPRDTRPGRSGAGPRPGRPERLQLLDDDWVRAEEDPDLLGSIRAWLDADDPVGLLVEVSGLLAVVDPRARRGPGASRDPEVPTLDELVGTLEDLDRPESAALLACVGVLAPDEVTRSRARRRPPPAARCRVGSPLLPTRRSVGRR